MWGLSLQFRMEIEDFPHLWVGGQGAQIDVTIQASIELRSESVLRDTEHLGQDGSGPCPCALHLFRSGSTAHQLPQDFRVVKEEPFQPGLEEHHPPVVAGSQRS